MLWWLIAGRPYLQPAPDHVRELIRRTRSLTERPFGAAIVLAFPHEENLRVVLEEKLAVLQVYWGEFPKERVDEAHRAGVKVLHQVRTMVAYFTRMDDNRLVLVEHLLCHY